MSHWRAAFSEGLGTALLVAAVIGSGIMAETLSQGNVGLALLANAIATGAMLFVLITVFGPLSGAQFNPLVSIWKSICAQQPWQKTVSFICAQIIGGILGALLANAMFDLELVQISVKQRGGFGQLLGEGVASFGLIFLLSSVLRFQPQNVASSVALYITSAYWFTSSTSFANPAGTIARIFSDTFGGISPASVLPFVLAQLAGMILAILAWRFLGDER